MFAHRMTIRMDEVIREVVREAQLVSCTRVLRELEFEILEFPFKH